MAGIPNDSEQPRGDCGGPAKFPNRTRCGPERLLNGIFGVLRCSAEAKSVPKDNLSMRCQQRLQSEGVSLLRGLQQRWVGRIYCHCRDAGTGDLPNPFVGGKTLMSR